MRAGEFEVYVEHEGKRARDDDLVRGKLGHADVLGLPRVGLRGVEGDALPVRSAFMAPRTFSECEGSRLGGTAMVYNVFENTYVYL